MRESPKPPKPFNAEHAKNRERGELIILRDSAASALKGLDSEGLSHRTASRHGPKKLWRTGAYALGWTDSPMTTLDRITAAPDVPAAWQDLYWAVLNSQEFTFQH